MNMQDKLQNKLQRDVMIRVRAIHFMRKFSNPTLLKSFVFALTIIVCASIVSVPHVVENLVASADGVGGTYDFFLAAFSNTAIAVKALVVFGLVTGGVLLLDLSKRLNLFKFRLA